MAQTDASPRSDSPRQLLGDITESAHNQANVARSHNAYAKNTSPTIDVNYYQQQYHSAVLQDAINVHAQYVQLQEQWYAAQAFMLQQQLMAQAGAQQQSSAPQHQSSRRKSTSPNNATQQQRVSPRPAVSSSSRRASPVTHHHGDDEASPCDCPDCNLRRLQEVMTEATVPYAATAAVPTARRFAPQQQPMPMDFDAIMAMNAMAYQQHINSPLMRGSMPTSPLMMGAEHMSPYGAYDSVPMPTASVTKHNPYAPHSPTSVPMNASVGYEVPYIPARGDYAHYATDAPAESRDASTEASLEEGEREIPTGKPQQNVSPIRRTGPPKPAPKQPARRSSPSLMDNLQTSNATAATSEQASAPAPAAAVTAPAAPTTSVVVGATAPRNQPHANSRRSSPKDNSPAHHHHQTSPQQHSSSSAPASGACPFLLRLKVSQWHTNVAVASPESVPVGTHIKFEGDRGEDLGCVVSCTQVPPEETSTLPRVRARATAAEAENHAAYAAEAAAAVPAAQTAVDRAGLHMRVVGAVYQFNREKLTFMYESTERIDFRQLVRDLYAVFRCRIWMEPVTPIVPTSSKGSHGGKRTTSPPQH